MMFKTSLVASLLAFSVLGAPVLEARHGDEALVGYYGDAKVKRAENEALVGYYGDAKIKREPEPSYPYQVYTAVKADVLGERGYIQQTAGADEAAVLD